MEPTPFDPGSAPPAPPVPPPAPSPFDRPVLASTRSAGVPRGVWIGCGAFLLLLMIAAGAFVLQRGKVVAWLYDVMETRVVACLPEDYPEAERERLHGAFVAAQNEARAGRIDPIALSLAQQEFGAVVEAAGKGKCDPAGLVRLTERMEALGPRSESP